MVIYGISFNRTKIDEDTFEELEDFLYSHEEVELVTGYSVSSYEPEMAIIGITLDPVNCLFNPIPLMDLASDANSKLADLIAEGKVSQVTEIAEKFAIDKISDFGEGKILLVEESDD